MASFTYRISYCTGSTQPAVGMRTYKKVGTDPILLKCYATYQQFCTMLKLDWLLQLQLLAFSFLGLQELSWQWWVTVGGQLPIGVAWLPMGLLAARRESRMLMMLLLVAAAAQPPMYLAQLLTVPPPNATLPFGNHSGHNHTLDNGNTLVSIFGIDDDDDPYLMENDGEDYGAPPNGITHYCTKRLRERTFPFESPALNGLYLLALLVRLIMLFSAGLVRNNFGKGLATRVHSRSDGPNAFGSTSSSVHGGGLFGSGSCGGGGSFNSACDNSGGGGHAANPNLGEALLAGGGGPPARAGANNGGGVQRVDTTTSEASTANESALLANRMTVGSGSVSTRGGLSQPGSYYGGQV